MAADKIISGPVELRLGRWQDVLADIESCDAVITDPPYSRHTHTGTNNAVLSGLARSKIAYSCIDEGGAKEIVGRWAAPCRGWLVVMTDDALSWVVRSAMHDAGRQAFASVSLIQHRPRLSGDGPGSCTVHIQTSRPREKEFMAWGSLPGWYKDSCARVPGVNGAKPLKTMRALIRDYSRPGDLVVDPYAGSGTTLIAAAIEGRRAIGAEMDPKIFKIAAKRIQRGWTPDLFTEAVE